MSPPLRARWLIVVTAGLLFASGCGEPPDDELGRSFDITVAPLSLPGLIDACYTLTVKSDVEANWSEAGTQTVWTASNLCGSRFGHKTEVAYVGTCDATPDGRIHTVGLEIEGIYDEANGLVPTTEWVNPCPVGSPCFIEAPCRENADTPIVFNLTVMRAANQGFFDVAVNFSDIFCSAKLDCRADSNGDGAVTDTDDYIQLLHHGSVRSDTVIMALACTAGAQQDTRLYLTNVEVACDGDVTHVIMPSSGPGNLSAIADAVTPALPNTDLFQVAVYHGVEQLADVTGSFAKRYWNIALGLVDPTGCTLSATATASDGELVGGMTRADEVYPVITFEADLATCTQHALDDGVVVATGYTPLGTPATFDHWSDGATASPVVPPVIPRRCVELLDADPSLTDGYYTIDVDGDPGTPNPTVYCDMTGGGWMRILDFDAAQTEPNVYLSMLGYFGDTTEIANAQYLYANDRGFGWGSTPAVSGTPTAEQAPCFAITALPTIDAMKVTIRAGANLHGETGYFFILEPGHDDEYAGWSQFQTKMRSVGFLEAYDGWNSIWDGLNVVKLSNPVTNAPLQTILASAATPNLDSQPFTFETAADGWPFDSAEVCMTAEGGRNYNRRYIQDVWVK